MKREEALEYMNRYLDHDLNEEETETLFRHLGESPDARADFEFLQGLSDKLESLPDVKPPVSLVDAILPRLDELDRLAPLEREEPEQPVVMLPGKQQMPPRRKAAAFWRSTMGRAVGGTAIAAAVLGIFVATYKPQEMPNAEVTSTTAVSNATDDTLVSGGAAQKTAPDLTDPSTEVQEMQPEAQIVPEEGATERKADPPAQEDAQDPPAAAQDQMQKTMPSTAPDSSGSRKTESGSDASSGAEQGGGAEPGTGKSNKSSNNDSPSKDSPAASDRQQSDNAKKSPPADSKPNTQPNANDKNGSNKNTAPQTQSPTPPADAPTATQKAQPNEGISAFGNEEDESADQAPSLQDSGTPESGTVEDSEADSRVYSLAAAPTEWTSPDSAYLIAYSPGTLTLLKGDRSEELGTQKIDGEATNGVWSADGKTFTYDLVKPDGTTASQIWKIEETTLKQGK
ncbi:hypothetical protein CDO73_14765 [Saccharibacillus sp. O23]|uniref:hypothetical protein n=1 Tax=Saccharibacillus sp. O23 TaxID=2009338 RepID=UPI000B4E0DF6|nr:hypothetical protein [Saccharibacillus sp. O23]OWR29453.1 hypothetical protein CDO73_14765 [Saccharibacillus sp. O23]